MSTQKIGVGIAVALGIGIAGYFLLPMLMNNTGSGLSVGEEVTTASGLKMKEVTVGSGEAARAGSRVTVNYVGKLQNGTIFDASAAHGQPFTFVLDADPQQVIAGWDEGVVGMRVGGKRTLTIPPNLGYGSRAIQGQDASGNVIDVIPANSTLIFEVELLKVEESAR